MRTFPHFLVPGSGQSDIGWWSILASRIGVTITQKNNRVLFRAYSSILCPLVSYSFI